jgi:hypothetical protein
MLLAALGCGRWSFDPVGGDANVVFVTSMSYLPSTFATDLAAADAICAQRAVAGGLAGQYVAYLSTPTVDARDRLAGARGWVRPDGKPFVDTIDDLVADRVLYPPRIDELGEDVMVNGTLTVPESMTATGSDGRLRQACADFATATAIGGPAYGTYQTWTNVDFLPCNSPATLYCFGVDKAQPLVYDHVPGRLAFTTVEKFAPGPGMSINSADTLCTTEAAGAHLPGSYQALLATSTATASSRFDLSGPNWVRVDGVPLAADPLALVAGRIDATLNFTADDATSTIGVATGGGLNAPATLAQTCDDWTNALGTMMYGVADRSGSLTNFFDYGIPGSCAPAPVYCLQF